MYRDIINDLVKWKDSRRRKPLLMTGVRQCGKTYIINEFGKSSFGSMVHLNFEESGSVCDPYEKIAERVLHCWRNAGSGSDMAGYSRL